MLYLIIDIGQNVSLDISDDNIFMGLMTFCNCITPT